MKNFRFFYLAFGLIACTPRFAIAKSNDSGSGTIFFIIFAFGICYWLYRRAVSKAVYTQLKEKEKELEAHASKIRTEIENKRQKVAAELEEKESRVASMNSAFNSSYLQGRRWLAEFIAEANVALDNSRANQLLVKKNPAKKAAEEVKRISAEKREILIRLKLLEYTLKTYHEYYPVLEQYSEDILDEKATLEFGETEVNEDAAKRYISKEEYARLGSVERNQLALNNWIRRPKSNVEIGRIYERYLGYLYERDGWDVLYFGATEGLEDMGRDLICTKESKVHVVQAKNWSKFRTIHEKHIFQLYGTTVLLPLTHNGLAEKSITAVFVTTTNLSETALWAAERLQVKVRSEPMNFEYPMIKCNVNGSSKIYHLPFDQQYDRVKIEPKKGEAYVATVQEAERKGFRRAMRFRG